MNSRNLLRIALDLQPSLRDLAWAAVRRQAGAEPVSSVAGADAVATDDVRTALRAAERQQGVLLFETDPALVMQADEAATRAGTLLVPAHPWRFRPSVEAAVRSLRSGELGSPGLVRIHRWEPRVVEVITASTILPEVDLICWVFDSSPSVIHAVRRGGDYLQFHFGFPGGGMAVADLLFGFSGSYHSFSIIGARGAAYADDHRNMSLHYAQGSTRALRTGQRNQHLLAIFREFAGTLQGGGDPAVTAAETRRAADAAARALALAGEGVLQP